MKEIDVAIFAFDAEGILRLVNPAARRSSASRPSASSGAMRRRSGSPTAWRASRTAS